MNLEIDILDIDIFYLYVKKYKLKFKEVLYLGVLVTHLTELLMEDYYTDYIKSQEELSVNFLEKAVKNIYNISIKYDKNFNIKFTNNKLLQSVYNKDVIIFLNNFIKYTIDEIINGDKGPINIKVLYNGYINFIKDAKDLDIFYIKEFKRKDILIEIYDFW